jgi:hypothetical protein
VIGIKFDPASLADPTQQEWWKAWKQRAETATQKVVEGFEVWLEQGTGTPFQFKFNNEIWKELKDWLLENVFYQKCAYCEREISGYYGDAEHYRPKGAVKRKTQAGSFEQVHGEVLDPRQDRIVTKSHPGYFWLAYDWRNLVPSCVYCNSGEGKNERFDAQHYFVMVKCDQAEVDALPPSQKPRQSKKWPGYYYLTPAGLDARESPLLLNPLNASGERDPRKHIRFGSRGTVAAVDESMLGRTSIETFQLQSEKLRIARQKAQEEFRSKYYDAMRKFDPSNPRQSEAWKVLEEYSRGRWPFSAAAIDYLKILSTAEATLAPFI